MKKMTKENKIDRNVKDTIAIADNLGLIVADLIKLRVDKGISQRDLAELTGLKQSAIARLEKLNAIPRLDTIITIAHFLGYTLTICQEQYYVESRNELLNYKISNNGIVVQEESGAYRYEIN